MCMTRRNAETRGPDLAADDGMDLLEDRGRLEWPQDVEGLAGSEQLEGDNLRHVLDDLKGLARGEATHADVVLLAGGGRDAVGRRRV